ncbi:MAG: FkbM family methyltransferase [Bacteroidota bacterium]
MFPEQLSMHLIKLVADEIDINRTGFAIEIGVGTSNFYALVYKGLGFNTIAVDPVPYAPFVDLALQHQIVFDESCIYLENGEQTIYISSQSDLSSLHNNWWGVTQNISKKVASQNLTTFIEKHGIEKITFFKVDTEGSEYEILQQFTSLSPQLLPGVIEFEFGGGGLKNEHKGGWEPGFYKKTLTTLELLKKLGYKEAIIFDSIELKPVLFSFESTANFDDLFKPNFEYGNLIAFKEEIKDWAVIKSQLTELQNELLIQHINNLKRENTDLYMQLIKKDLLGRIARKIKRTFGVK